MFSSRIAWAVPLPHHAPAPLTSRWSIPCGARSSRRSAACRASGYRSATGTPRVPAIPCAVTSLRRVAPVFVTTDLARALAHYQRLGFVVEAYDGADYYGYACRDGIEIHFAKVDSIDCATTTSCAYLWVDDAAALHSEWSAAGVDGRLVAPTSTAYGLDEGAHVDLDGNLIRFGSPPLPPRALR